MQKPVMLPPRQLDEHVTVLPAAMPIPGAGVLPVNAALIRGPQAVLVDTGLAALQPEFLDTLYGLVDPGELRWIWITHADADHIGNLGAVFERSPAATLVTNFLALGKLGLAGIAAANFRLLNPGQELALGDRRLVALTHPVYDAPETMAAFDPSSRTLFSSDCCGALLTRAVADAGELSDDELRAGLLDWSRVDAPWLGDIDRHRFAANLEAVRRLGVERLVSSHLPPAVGLTDRILRHLAGAPDHHAYRGPDHEAFAAMLARAADA